MPAELGNLNQGSASNKHDFRVRGVHVLRRPGGPQVHGVGAGRPSWSKRRTPGGKSKVAVGTVSKYGLELQG